MKFGWRHAVSGAIGVGIIGWLGMVASAAGQAAPAPAPGPQMSEAFFKNIQVLKGIPVDEFMDAMGMFASSLGYDCASCHTGISTNRALYPQATPKITKARAMVTMVNTLNRNFFAGQPRVTCFTCHRGKPDPEAIPSLELQYSVLTDDPSSINLVMDRRTPVDQVFTKYLNALGGQARVGQITSYTAAGTYAGFNTGGADVPVEVFAKAPNLRAQVVRTPEGESIKVFDGSAAWAAEQWRPMPLLALTGGNLSGARVDGLVAFPAGLRQAFAEWKVGTAIVEDKNLQVLQGSNPGGELPVNFYFDDSGLLVRQVRWNKTSIGTVPSQVDYSDYRDVNGVKLPFKIVTTWTDGQNTYTFKEIKPNVAIEAARFARPAPWAKRS